MRDLEAKTPPSVSLIANVKDVDNAIPINNDFNVTYTGCHHIGGTQQQLSGMTAYGQQRSFDSRHLTRWLSGLRRIDGEPLMHLWPNVSS